MMTALLSSALALPALAALVAGAIAGWFSGEGRLTLFAAGTAAAVVTVWRTFGLRPALAALAAGAILIAHRRGEARGAARQHEKEKADADQAVERARRARDDADRRDADPRRLRDDDGFRRD